VGAIAVVETAIACLSQEVTWVLWGLMMMERTWSQTSTFWICLLPADEMLPITALQKLNEMERLVLVIQWSSVDLSSRGLKGKLYEEEMR